QGLSGLRVEDLRVEVVLPDVRPLALADGLVRHAGADDLRQPVDVRGLDAQAPLHVLPDGLGPRLGAEDAVLEWYLLGRDAAPGELLGERLRVGRRARDHL